MATRKRSGANKKSQAAPGWLWMLFGLSLGLVVAAAIYISDRRATLPAQAERLAPAQSSPREPVAGTASETGQAPQPEPDQPHPAMRFDFYDMLPQFEVVLPEVDATASADVKATAVEEPGSYVLQAGSFRTLADADRMQANLALLGIESRIQRVAIDDDIYHRVRVGPTKNLDELNQVRRRLWDAQIEVLLIRVAE